MFSPAYFNQSFIGLTQELRVALLGPELRLTSQRIAINPYILLMTNLLHNSKEASYERRMLPIASAQVVPNRR